MERTVLYRTIWRWHFYAGLFVMPFVVLLSLSGAFYLFKPQVDRWEERAYRGLDASAAVSPSRQLEAAMGAFPDSKFVKYRLPEASGDAAAITLDLEREGRKREVFVSPQGKVLGSLDPKLRIMELDAKFHANFILGVRVGWVVETAACWVIIMIVTGLYLWWPAGRGLAGVLWPRRASLVRDLHAVTGFWVSTFAMLLLLSGLPWAPVWGKIFEKARTEVGLVQGKRDWKIGGQEIAEHHTAHQHQAAAPADDFAMLDLLVARARSEPPAFPGVIKPPGNSGFWTLGSEAQNRPLQTTISYDAATGAEVARETIADKHPIDRVIAYTTAWHEGQLFGVANQIIGVLTATALITMVVTSFLLWRKRKPEGLLGAPPRPASPQKMRGVALIIVLLALALPMLAVSLILVLAIEKLVLPLFPGGRKWLGLPV